MRRISTAASRRARTAAAALALATSALALVPAATAQAGPGPLTAPHAGSAGTSIAALRAEVARTGDRLAAATVAWERSYDRLGRLMGVKITTEHDAEELAREAAAAQQRAAAFASDLYKNPYSPMVLAVLRGNVDSISDLDFARRALSSSRHLQQADLQLLTDRRRWSEQIARRHEQAALAALRLQTQLDEELSEIQADAQASLDRLEAAVAELRRRQDAAAAAALGMQSTGSGATCEGPVPAGAVNGFLPASALCPLSTAPGHRLVKAAAAAFDAMSRSFAEAFGTPLCVSDSYRDYQGQVRVFSQKPNLAATPGRSQHGWGRAVDLCGGVQTFGTPPYNWLKANAGRFGFAHPAWAEPGSSRPEPWHWEFIG